MRFPSSLYQVLEEVAARFPDLRPAQQRGLAFWVSGALLARSACQNAVFTALTGVAGLHALRQRLREWLYDGTDRTDPCKTQLEVTACFGPLTRWLLSLWEGDEIALAVDATTSRDRTVALVVSALYRGSAIPLAWKMLPANTPGAWMPHLLALLDALGPHLAPPRCVVVLADRGLWSPRLWARIQKWGWHPLLRLRGDAVFQPLGGTRQRARSLIPGRGHAWIGRGTAFHSAKARRFGTLLVVWGERHEAPWVLLSDLAPAEVGAGWYGLRCWIEVGFRALKKVGWRWEQTRRADSDRISRHWLVLAVATLWSAAYGTREEDAAARGVAPGRLRGPTPQDLSPPGRLASVLERGVASLLRHLLAGRPWRRLWLRPEPWPATPPGIQVTIHSSLPQTAPT